MSMKRVVCGVVFAVSVLFSAAIPAVSAERDAVTAFLQVTGFDAAISSIAQAAEQAPQMLGQEADDFGTDWKRVAAEVFDVAGMQETAIDILTQTLDGDDLAHAAEFYASDLGQRLVIAENAAHLDPDDDARRAKGEQLVAEMVASGDARLAILQRMNRAIDAGDTSVRAVQEIQLRFLLAASQAGVIGLGFEEPQLRLLLQEGEAELRLSLQKSALMGAAQTYAPFSDADMEAYASALEEPKMQRVYELLNAVQYEIMANRFEALARRLAELRPAQEL